MKPHFDAEQDEILGKAYDGRLIRRFSPTSHRTGVACRVAIVFLIGTSLLDLVPPYLTKVAIDRYITPHKPAGLTLIFVIFVAALS